MFSMLTGSALNKSILFLTILLSNVFATLAQVNQTDQFSLELRDDEEKYRIAGLGEKGAMLYRQVSSGNEDRIELIKIDTTLKTIWKNYFIVAKSLNLLRVQQHKEFVYFLFKDRLTIGGDFKIAVIEANNGEFGSYTVKNVIPFLPVDFIVTDDAALIGGYFNYRPLVVYFGFKEQNAKILPGFFNEPGELDQLKSYKDGSLDVIVNARNIEKKRCLWIRNYSPQGDLIKTTIIQPEKGKNLIFGHSVKLESGEQIVAGVYGRYSYDDISRGIFVAGINPEGEYAVDYYNFAHLKNFFSYMKAKKLKRVKERIERKTIRGKKIKFNYRFIIHDIIPYKNQYIMTGEAFYPHYVYPNQYLRGASTRVYYNSYYSSPYRSDMILDGYQYTHAVVIGFDKTGKIIWDNSFEINDVKTMELQKFVKVRPEKDRILMMYLFSNTLRTKIIHDSEVLEGKSQDAMKIDFNDALINQKSTESEHLDYWYGDYFYAFGVQRIQMKYGATKRILFINKISYK